MTFFGEDLNPSGGALTSTPQSDQARANFFANLQGVGTETFEGIAVGTQNPSISFPGVGTATLNGSGDVESGLSGSDQYPISGTHYYNAGTDSFSVTFSAAIAAFGFYATDVGDFGGQVTLTLNKVGGGSTVLTVPNLVDPSADGSALYFGFYDTGTQYSSITFGNTGDGDVFGFDDFSVGAIAQVVPTTINTTGGDIASNIFSLGSKAAQAGTVQFDGGVLRMIGGTFPNNIIPAPVTIDANNGIVDTSTGNGGFSGVVSGPGSLTIEGGGTFSLTGANTYQGGTIVDASTVAVGAASALGTGPLSLNGGGVEATVDGLSLVNAAVLTGVGIIDTQAFGLTYAGTISGTGALLKSGTGTLVLSGSNVFSGDTMIASGTLQAGAAAGLSPNSVVVVGGGATLDLHGFNPTTAGLAGTGTVTNSAATPVTITVGSSALSGFGGIIADGAGGIALSKIGTSTLVLSGADTYSGGTALHAGTLAVGNAAALGTGTLRMDDGTTLAFAADGIDVPNAIVFTGAADPTFDTGPNDATVSGPISGPGDLTKIGTGTLDLTGTNTYTGATIVAQGTLLIDGSTAASAATVDGGAVLGGFGTIGGLNVLGGATLAPGARTPFSTLTVAGNAVFQAGSTFAVRINPAGQTDAVAIGGAATLNGGTVAVIAAPGAYTTTNRYTILTAAGGRTGTFDGLTTTTTNLAFLSPTLGYTPNSVTLGFTQTAAFAAVATTINQRNTAAAVQSLGPGNPVNDAVLGQTAAGAQRAFGTLSGEAHGSATTTAVQGSRMISGIVFDRLWNIPGSGGDDALSALDQFGPTTLPTLLRCYAPVPGPAGEVPSHYTVWGQAIGDFGRSGGDGNAAAVDRTLGGFAFGIDTRLDAKGFENWRVGATAGYTNSDFSVGNGGGAGSYENAFGGLYAGARYGAVDIRLGATYGGTSTNLHRTVAFPGFNEAERSSYGGDTIQGFGELGYRFGFGKAVLEPVIDASVNHVHQDGYSEKGGPAALRGFAQDVDVESTVLGFRGEATPFANLPIVARMFLGWQHSYGDIDPAATVAFASGSSAFDTYGAPIDRNSVVAEAGADWRATSALTVGLFYTGQAGRRDTDNAVKGRMDYRF